MTSGNIGEDDAVDDGVENKLRALSSVLLNRQQIIINEILQSWDSFLTEKESKICQWAYVTMSNLNSGNSAPYEDVVKYAIRNEDIFTGEKETHDTITNLVSKALIEDKLELWKFGSINRWREENMRVLRFKCESLYKELVSASNERFFWEPNAFFYPRNKSIL